MVPGAYFSFKGYETHKLHGKSMIKTPHLYYYFCQQVLQNLIKSSQSF